MMISKLHYIITRWPALILCSLLVSCSGITGKDYLRNGFINPPDTAKPGVYWYFMDGNIDRKAITEDLEAMKQAGIGYALFLEVNVGIPRGKVEFMSNEWMDLFGHAVREAGRLGIRIILGSGPGWAGSGGPWVKPEQSMMHIVSADTIIAGPVLFDTLLPVPKPKRPFFGERTLTPELKTKRDEWYEDVKVLAFPESGKKYEIENLDEKAFYYRPPYTSQPGVVPFINLSGLSHDKDNATIKKEKIIDLSPMYLGKGRLTWNVPPGRWIIVRFGKRNNGAVTRPAPLPGLGFESDKFDTAALGAHFRAYIGRLAEKVKPEKIPSGGGWTMLHIDSWEMGAQNWSHRFVDEFIKRRNYDPVLYLPVFAGYIVNSKEESERFLWDVRQTAGELIVENHAGYFKELGRRYGFTLSIEPYDMNPAPDFDLGAVADVPMGEFWTAGHGFNSAFSCIEATSVGHVTGKPVIAAEAFTADRTEAWKMYPGNMKNQTDWALALGINRFIFHTFAHKPYGDKLLPGMTMGPYGVHWDRGQTWWPLVNEYHKYLSRCQFMLMQGAPVADILYLTPEGAPDVFVPPVSALEGSDTLPDKKGYSFDACSPAYLIKYASVFNNRIIFPSGASYTLLVLPLTEEMTPELADKISTLLRGGAFIAGQRPLKSPSLSGYPACDEKLTQLTETIWGIKWSQGKSQIKYINGTLFKMDEASDRKSIPGKKPFDNYPDYDTIAFILKGLGTEPDFTCSGKIRYNHRRLPGRHIYFISNRSEETVYDTCRFRDGSDQAEIWNPLTGEIKKSISVTSDGRGAVMPVRLEPFQSLFMVFYETNGIHAKVTPSAIDYPQKDEVMVLSNPWKVSFDPALGGPGEVIFDTLTDWSVNRIDGIKYYSGRAFYRCTFSLPPGKYNKKLYRYYLGTGEIHNLAGVRLNGEDAGILWTYPWEADITGLLKEKENLLEIEVANLWINRLTGDEAEPWDGVENGMWPDWLIKDEPRPTRRFTFTTHRYYKKDDPLSPSGLKGPVRILSLKR